MHVLFVCTGNVCRSVIAERLTRAFADRHGLHDLTAESAGVRALVGFGVEPLAAQTITGLGGDPDNFKARRFKPEMAQRADLVLAMTEQIRDDVARQAPDTAHYCFTLLEAFRIAKVSGARTIPEMDRARNDLAFVGRENIADPSSLSPQRYLEVGDAIAEALLPLLFALHLHQGRSTDAQGRPQLIVLDGGKSTRTAPAPQVAFYDSGRIGRHA
ncbi:arsenate reductase/protein-tyrosine-phosphatase family protein [Nocardia stercoris]|uniref:Low molecular weight phosphatase family protein n=1 Tax=Nocardia stercoris TaxID=2483361 RepID=A0A3M2KZG0_9NOCA|nr:low molecular weight phosphatase family protein [Nocardia stercoris]RMI29830.1 low molecular weight phosphatase family protein [Nocardia stercoris]